MGRGLCSARRLNLFRSGNMPDTPEYCNAEVQYIMILVKSLPTTATQEDIKQAIVKINRQFPAMLSGAGRKNVCRTVYDFLNNGVKFYGMFHKWDSA